MSKFKSILQRHTKYARTDLSLLVIDNGLGIQADELPPHNVIMIAKVRTVSYHYHKLPRAMLTRMRPVSSYCMATKQYIYSSSR